MVPTKIRQLVVVPNKVFITNLPAELPPEDLRCFLLRLAPVGIDLKANFAVLEFENENLARKVLQDLNRAAPFNLKAYPARRPVYRAEDSENPDENMSFQRNNPRKPRKDRQNSSGESLRSQNPITNNGHYLSNGESPQIEKYLIKKALENVYLARELKNPDFCQRCGRRSYKKCGRCLTPYCSEFCQNADWTTHKPKCDNLAAAKEEKPTPTAAVPGSRLPADENEGQRRREFFNQTKPSDLEKSLANDISGQLTSFRRRNDGDNERNRDSRRNDRGRDSKRDGGRRDFSDRLRGAIFQDDKKSNGPARRFNRSDVDAIDRRKNFNEEAEDEDWSVPDSKNPEIKPSVSVPEKKISVPEKKEAHFSDESVRTSKAVPDKPKQKEVLCLVREAEDKYWAIDNNEISTWQIIQERLSEAEKFPTIKPSRGLLCGCLYEEVWYRGRIVSTDPLRVHYVDYGNTSECGPDVKELPKEVKAYPPMAFHITFMSGTPDKYLARNHESNSLSVDLVRETKTGFLVRISGEEYPQETNDGACSSRSSQPAAIKKPTGSQAFNRTSSIGFLTKTSDGIFTASEMNNSVVYGMLVPGHSNECEAALEIVVDLQTSGLKKIQADVGDNVLVEVHENDAYRGVVLSKDEDRYVVNLIDRAVVATCEEVYETSQEIASPPELGVKVTITDISNRSELLNMINENAAVLFNVVGSEDGRWLCSFSSTTSKNPKEFAKGFVEKWEPSISSSLSYVELKSKSVVLLGALTPTWETYYVRPIDEKSEREFVELNADVAAHSKKALPYDSSPAVGEICAAKFKADDQFYRALVLSTDGGIRIRFSDFGNDQKTPLEDLRPLPRRLKSRPFYAVEVKLKGLRSDSVDEDGKEYLTGLMAESKELILTYQKDLSDGVFLTEKATGIVVNDHARKNSPESPKTAAEKSDSFMMDDLQCLSLGKGASISLIYADEDEFTDACTFWCTDKKTNSLAEIEERVARLSAGDSAASYEPEEGECCLAEFDNGWYRGVCLRRKGESFYIFFIDYGNSSLVKRTSIRKMSRELMEEPAQAVRCVLDCSEKLKGKKDLKTKVLRLLASYYEKVIKDAVVVKKEEDLHYISIPEVDEILSGF